MGRVRTESLTGIAEVTTRGWAYSRWLVCICSDTSNDELAPGFWVSDARKETHKKDLKYALLFASFKCLSSSSPNGKFLVITMNL